MATNYPPHTETVHVHDHIQYNIDEIKSMREEVNWRVKIAYTSSVVFISLASLAVGQVYNTENQFLEHIRTDPGLLVLTLNLAVIVISAWVGVQNANHLISSRIELYQLRMVQAIYFQSREIFASWIPFLYGSPIFHSQVKNVMAKLLTASIGIFQYFFPNILALWVWYYQIANLGLKGYAGLFVIATFCLTISIGASCFLLFFKMKITKESEVFYEKCLKRFYDNLFEQFSKKEDKNK